MAAASLMGTSSGKKITVFAQGDAFGQANATAVKQVMSGRGATVQPLLVPPTATDLTPFALKAKAARPDLLYVAWAGTTAQAMWSTLDQQGLFTATKVVTGLDYSATWSSYGGSASKVDFIAHYFAGAAGTPVEKSMTSLVTRAGSRPELFTVDGFTAAQMVVHAAMASGDDVEKMVDALTGWTFAGVKGTLTIRRQDHALLQPMFLARLTGGADPRPEPTRTLPADAVAPPVHGS
jgi:branched-chain amino acid transport system substrate-binding protein